jgi:D-beta-D-heptose 7-phosphate kinase/D-beta-D-heptose 1-phosphate adenosyltransferase
MTLFQHGSGPVDVAAQAVEVFDVTGAGDTVAATLVAALAAGASHEQAARLASLAAAVVVRRVGTCAVRLAELFGTADQGSQERPGHGSKASTTETTRQGQPYRVRR